MKEMMLVKVSFLRDEGDTVKMVTEDYLVKRETFGNTETTLYDNLPNDNLVIKSIKRENIDDVFIEDEDEVLNNNWFKAETKYQDVIADKPLKHIAYVNAYNITKANDTLKESLKDLYHTFEIVSLKLTKVLEIIE